MATYLASIHGLSALLMHRWSEESEVEAATRTVHIAARDPRTEAEKVCYRRPDGTLYLPGPALAKMLSNAGSNHKQRGSRRSMRFIVPAAILVLGDDISLLDDNGEPLTHFEVDSRPVVIPSTKGRIMRHRPRLNQWACEVPLQVDETLIEASLALQLLQEGGSRHGVGDFRPEKTGQFGRFEVVSWKLIAGEPAKPADEPEPEPAPRKRAVRKRRAG